MDKEDILYQHGTLALLVPGLFKGTATVGSLLEHGDFGIGSVEALDGELIIVDSVPYLAKSTGEVLQVDKDVTVPFANAHFDRPTDDYDRKDMTRGKLEAEVLKLHDYANIFFGIKIIGTFKSMKTRAVNGGTPYKTLAQTAQDQSIFNAQDITGTLVGYYTPEAFQGVGSAGFHVHFVDDDHQFGGHILDYELAEGKVSLQRFSDLDLHLPIHDFTYRRHQFDYEDMDQTIRGAEGNRG